MTTFVSRCFLIGTLVVAWLPAEALPPGERFQIAVSDTDLDRARDLVERYLKSEGDEGAGRDLAEDAESADNAVAGEGEESAVSSPAEPEDAADVQTEAEAEPAPVRRQVDPADRMFVQVRMKLARRAFRAKNRERAKAELHRIFDRIPDFAEARFMRAVIAAQEREFIEAWRHIEIAKRAAPGHPRIMEFVGRLQEAFPRPDILPEAAPEVRPTPTFAAGKVAHALEKLLAHKAIGSKLTAVAATGFAEDGELVRAVLSLEPASALDPGEAKRAVEEAMAAATVGEPVIASPGETLEFPVALSGIPLRNPAPQPIPDPADFLGGVSEETDVAVQDTSTDDPDSSRVQAGTYSVAAANIGVLNDFLDKIAPHTVEFSINRLHLTTFRGASLWRGELQILFQLP